VLGLPTSGGALGAGALTKPSGVTSVEARPPGVSLESMISHDGLFCRYCELGFGTGGVYRGEFCTHDLVQTLRSTETCWASADNEDVDIAVQRRVSNDIGGN
jgi:hypothetical protein